MRVGGTTGDQDLEWIRWNEVRPATRTDTLNRWGVGEVGLLLAGAAVGPQLLDTLRATAAERRPPAADSSGPVLANVDFGRAQFTRGEVDLSGVVFGDKHISFRGADFADGDVDFSGATFRSGTVDFSAARFGRGDVKFRGTKFGEGSVSFDSADVGARSLDFTGAVFGDSNVSFRHVSFECDRLSFSSASFGTGFVDFTGVSLADGVVVFDGASFEGGAVSFRGVLVATGTDVRFTKNTSFGSANLDLRETDWANQIRGLDCGDIDLSRARLRSGALIRTTGEVKLESARVEGRLEIRKSRRIAPGLGPRVATMSDAWFLDRVRIGDGVWLGTCDLSGSFGLDQLVLTGRHFAETRRGKRQVLANDPDHPAHDKDETATREATEDELQDRYRQLRQSMEAGGNHAGADDFYYAEMQARRRGLSRRGHRLEQTLVWLYWVVSGYGQRARRSIAAFLVVLVAGMVLFEIDGFSPFDNYPGENSGEGDLAAWPGTFVFTLRSMVSVTSAPGDINAMSAAEHLVQVGLRVLGPLLIALTALAVRGRVKR